MRVAGLFAGIGGIERGLQAALSDVVQTDLLCEWWGPAQQVLKARFPDASVHSDVATLNGLPEGTDLVTAGFPCTDLSQAGRTAGITGKASGLVAHVFRLLEQDPQGKSRPDLLIENVPNMLTLGRGEAMRYLVTELEALGYRWAYRTVDSRFTGLPQRRRRVILLASTRRLPEEVLFADNEDARPDSAYRSDAFGFYWTEGNRGTGWAQDAVPPLKGSSGLGIPSPPAIWIPGAETPVVVPSISDAEALQGFERGWTEVPLGELSPARVLGVRWKLVGNAVTTRVAQWVGTRLANPGTVAVPNAQISVHDRWPLAAWGGSGKVWQAAASEFPINAEYEHLLEVVVAQDVRALSDKALRGFTSRFSRSSLRKPPNFLEALTAECDARGILLPN